MSDHAAVVADTTAVGRADRTVAKDTAIVAVLTLMSRLTGFARVVATAAVLGVNRFSDLYQSLNLLPNYTHELLTGTLITALLVPPLVRHLDAGDLASVGEVAGGFLSLVAAAAMVVIVAVVAAGSLVVGLLTLGVNDAPEQRELIRLGWPLLALLMPQVLFYATAATGAAVQNASGRFALPALAPIIENVAILIVLGFWAGLFGRGIDSIAGIETGQAAFLGLGTTAAVFLHALLQWIGAARCGVRLVPRIGWRNPEVRAIVRLALPSAGYTALNTARLLVFLVAAGLVAGGQTVFLIALNFFYLPVAITSRPLATTALPVLARLRGMRSEFVERFLSTAGVMLFLVMPAAALMSGLAKPIATLGLWGPASDGGAVILLTAAVASVALAVPGESLFVLSTSASYAREDASSPLRAMGLRLAITVALVSVIALWQQGEPSGWSVLAALGLTMAVADATASGYLAQRTVSGAGRLLTTVLPHLLTGVGVLAFSGSAAVLADELFGTTRMSSAAVISFTTATTFFGLVVIARRVESNEIAGFIGFGSASSPDRGKQVR